MCLAVPGKLVEIVSDSEGDALDRRGVVDFQSNRVEVGLALVPEAQQGQWVLVHAGFAIQILDEDEARETWQALEDAGVPLEGDFPN